MWHPASMSVHSVAAGAMRRLPFPVRQAALHRLGRYAPWEAGFDHTPPALGAGETAGPPDFVGVGVQKAGTTWWHSLIAAHPDVTTRPDIHKERHFLSRFGDQAFTPGDIVAYHGWFPRTPGTLSGEWTPDYLYYPWVAPLLRTAAPKARLLVTLRDPVERFVSGLAHQLRFGAPRTAPTVAEAVGRGFYARQLQPWMASWDEGQRLILQYERCELDPAGELARTYRHIGLDDTFRPSDLHRRVSGGPEGRSELDPDTRRRLVDLYTPDVAALRRALPGLDLSLWPNFIHLATA
jgi:Sulfotransferase domain